MRVTVFFMIVICLLTAGSMALVAKESVSSSRVLRLEFQREKGFLEISAIIDGKTLNSRIEDKGKQLTRRMNQLNTMLENYGKHGDGEFRTELTELGSLVFGPFEAVIAKADTVAIGIAADMTRFPFEHLHFQGKPLGLQKPVVVYFDQLSAPPFSFVRIKSALVLADLTADPQEACRKAAKNFKNADYNSLDDVETDYLKELEEHDLLLVSAHGDVSFGNEDCIEYDEESFYPKSWAKVAPKLAYFDSCQVGASFAFVDAFREAGTQYFLAPITSNEAGNSSTMTIENFFAGLKAGESPENALFQAKVQMFDHYSAAGKNSYGRLLYYSMPFRVYRLN